MGGQDHSGLRLGLRTVSDVRSSGVLHLVVVSVERRTPPIESPSVCLVKQLTSDRGKLGVSGREKVIASLVGIGLIDAKNHCGV